MNIILNTPRSIGAKFIGQGICKWGGEASMMSNFEKASEPEVKDWAFTALDTPVK
jgi:hypothetical protein